MFLRCEAEVATRCVLVSAIRTSHQDQAPFVIEVDSRCVLVSAAGMPIGHLQVVCLHSRAAVKLRLIEQACGGCSTVQGGGGVKVA